MSTQEGCSHEEVYWKLDAPQEKGWHCLSCNERLGFRPDLDRKQTPVKVEAILHTLHDAGITYVSNSTEGYQLVRHVAEHCRRANVYDQQSIAFFLLDEQERKRFWQQTAQRWLEEGHPL